MIRCDVRSDEEWRNLWSEAESFLGGAVTLLVNNAGVAANNGQDNWRRCLDINFMGVAIGTYMALDKMDNTKVSLE